jgi:hypothetical protein
VAGGEHEASRTGPARPSGLQPRADRGLAREEEARMGVSGRHLLEPSAGGPGGRRHRPEAAAVFPILPVAFRLVRTE